MKTRIVIGAIEFDGEGDPAATSVLIRQFVGALFPSDQTPASGAKVPTAVRIDAAHPADVPLPRIVADRPSKTAKTRKPKARAAKEPNREPTAFGGEAAKTPLDNSRQGRIDRIAKFLDKVGHAGPTEIANACSIPLGSVSHFLKDTQFEKDESGDYRTAY